MASALEGLSINGLKDGILGRCYYTVNAFWLAVRFVLI